MNEFNDLRWVEVRVQLPEKVTPAEITSYDGEAKAIQMKTLFEERPDCEWAQDSKDGGVFYTGCGGYYFFINADGSEVRKMKFCCYCRKTIKIKDRKCQK